MPHSATVIGRTFSCLLLAPRKRIATCLLVLLFAVFTIVIFTSANVRVQREDEMAEKMAIMQSHLQFLESQYRGRQEDVIALQAKLLPGRGNTTPNHVTAQDLPSTTVTPKILALLKNMTGTKAASGVQTKNLPQLRTPFVYQLLPHLMNDPYSLKPAYHMRGGRSFCDIVVGVPTVKRDKESYLMITLSHLVTGLSSNDINNTLIVVMVGDTDLEYVINTARRIETQFPKHVERGLIEVISPPAAYYPNFDTLPVTLGDSHKRVKWRTKQNLDNIYLMAYAHTKGTFYLMLEDDVVAKNNYIQEIKKFTAATTVSNPHWFFIEYCHVGGIGKLFRSSDLIHFITYVQLFYNNMPIDWLLESYLADRVCTIEKNKKCNEAKEKIRPKYKSSLFQHIGLYSSLKGKIQKIKDAHFGAVPTYYPHLNNPPLLSFKTDIQEHAGHALKKAYDGQAYFWGEKPKQGDVIEFWFEKPVTIIHYTFRSGNVEHVSDKFYYTTVEVLPFKGSVNFTSVGSFDEFGLAEGDLRVGAIVAIRLKVNKPSKFWVILSEIELKQVPQPKSR